MATSDWHCPKCEGDYKPYIQLGDTIQFWFRPLQTHVTGQVVAIDGRTYTIRTNATLLSVDHNADNPVSLLAREGLPTTLDAHIAYVRQHHIIAPNITRSAKLHIRQMLKKGTL